MSIFKPKSILKRISENSKILLFWCQSRKTRSMLCCIMHLHRCIPGTDHRGGSSCHEIQKFSSPLCVRGKHMLQESMQTIIIERLRPQPGVISAFQLASSIEKNRGKGRTFSDEHSENLERIFSSSLQTASFLLEKLLSFHRYAHSNEKFNWTTILIHLLFAFSRNQWRAEHDGLEGKFSRLSKPQIIAQSKHDADMFVHFHSFHLNSPACHATQLLFDKGGTPSKDRPVWLTKARSPPAKLDKQCSRKKNNSRILRKVARYPESRASKA